MKSGVFQDAMESSAKVFGRKDVNVIFEGSAAHTDGGTIFLPALPPSAEINVDQADIIRGYQAHESMHVRVTDTSPDSMLRLKTLNEKGNGHHSTLLQYCEDVRIEHAGTSEYPGMKHGLSATNTHSAKMLLEQIEGRGPAAVVVNALPKALQFRMMLQGKARAAIGVESGGIFEALTEHIKASDPVLHDLAEKYAKKMVELPTGYANGKLNEKESKLGTAKSFDLADEIFAAYEDYEEQSKVQQPPPPQPGGQPGNGDGGDGDGEISDQQDHPGDQGSGDGEGEGDAPGKAEGGGEEDGDDGEDEGDDTAGGDSDGESDGDGAKGTSNGGGAGGDGDEDGSGNGDGTAEQPDRTDTSKPGDTETHDSGQGAGHGNNMATAPPEEDSVDVSGINDDDLFGKALNDVVSEINQEKGHVQKPKHGRKKGLFGVWSNRFSIKVPMQDAVRCANGWTIQKAASNAVYYLGLIEKATGGQKSMIRRVLELELQARSDRHWESGHKSGRLQSVRLVQAIQGREAVYQKRQDGRDMDTILSISIDGSGSMAGGFAEAACALALALSEALERTGCDIEVSMWGNFIYDGKGASYTKKDYAEASNAYGAEIQRRRLNLLPARYVAFGLLTRAVIKSKRQRTTDPTVRQAFGLGCESLSTGTPSYQAVFADLTDLAKENHSKKIYLHITDGDSDTAHEGQSGKEIMDEAHQYASGIGVHMIGVGIGGMRVDHLFPDNVQVGGADAYEPVIRKLAKLIAKEAGHAAGFKRAA